MAGLCALALLAGGCPTSGDAGDAGATAGGLTSGAAPAPAAGDQSAAGPLAPGATTGSAGNATPGTSGDSADPSFDDQLASEFPSCLEPRDVDAMRQEIFDLVNEERAKFGLNLVVRNETLENQATEYACEMIQYDFFAHVNPVTGSTLRERTREFGYPFLVVGENLAAGQSTPQEAMNAWIASSEHRENLLDPRFVELGVGIRSGGSFGIYWVQEFGRPISAGETDEGGP